VNNLNTKKPFTRSIKLVYSLLLLTISTFASSQSFTKSDKLELLEFCDSFTAVEKHFDADSSSSTFQHMVSDTLYSFFKIRREYFKLQDIQLHYLPVEAAVAKKIDNHFQCQMHNSDTFIYALDVRKTPDGYEVFGFNNNPFKQKYYDLYANLVDSITTERILNVAIDSAVAKFVDAYVHFSQTGDIRLMQPLSVGIDFDLLKLDRVVDSLEQQYFKRKFKVRDFEKTQRTSDSTAICEIYTTAGSADFELIKKDNVWLITEVNDLTKVRSTYDELMMEKQRLLQVKGIETAIATFDSLTLQYLVDKDANKLQKGTSAQISALVYLFQKQIGQYKSNHMRLTGVQFSSKYTHIKFNPEYTKATFTQSDAEVVLQRTDRWRVIGINKEQFTNSAQWMYENFHIYIKLFGAYLYPYDDQDMEVISVIAEGAEDSSVLDQLTKFKIRPTSTVGNKLLFHKMDSLTTDIMSQNTELKPGIVYLDFIVEKNGKFSDLKIASSTNSVLDAYAIHVFNKLPKWAPAVYFNDFSRARFVLPILFQPR